MKTNLKRISKRSLALILGILMLFSTLMVGSISVNADSTTYYLWYGRNNQIQNWTTKILMTSDGNGNYYADLDFESGNYYFTVNTIDTQAYGELTKTISATLETGTSCNNIGEQEFNYSDYTWKFPYTSRTTSSTVKIRFTYKPKSNSITLSNSDGSSPGGSTGGGDTPTYKLMKNNQSAEGTEAAIFTGSGTTYTATYNIDTAGDYYFYVNDGTSNYLNKAKSFNDDKKVDLYKYTNPDYTHSIKLVATTTGTYTFTWDTATHVTDNNSDGTLSYTAPTETPTSYTISSTANQSTITGLPESANSGDTVTFTVTANTGYKVDSVTMNEETLTGNNGSYTFEMPSENVSIVVTTSKVQSSTTTYYIRGDKIGNWGGYVTLTPSSDGTYYYYENKNDSLEFKITTSTTDWNNAYGYTTYVKDKFNSSNVPLSKRGGGGDGDDNIVCNTNPCYILFYPAGTSINTGNTPVICAATSLPSGGQQYSITGTGDTNSRVVVQSSAAAGATVSFSLRFDPGYELKTLTVTGAESITPNLDNTGTYTFTMPASAVTISVTSKASQVVVTNKYYIRGTVSGVGNWTTSAAMTISTDGFYEYYYVSDGSDAAFLIDKDNTLGVNGSYNYNNINSKFNGTNVAVTSKYSTDNGNKNIFVESAPSAYYVIVYYPNTEVNTSTAPIICAATTLPEGLQQTVNVVAKDGTITGSTATKYAAMADTTITASADVTGVTNGTECQTATAKAGKEITIKTTIDAENKADYFVKGWVVNGESVGIRSTDTATDNGVYETTFTIDPLWIGDNGNLEITPVFYHTVTESNKNEFITFYVEDFNKGANEKWGNTVACYPYYYVDDKVDNAKKDFGEYPGQPMLKGVGDRYFVQIAKTCETYPISGITLNNYHNDSQHKEWSGTTANLQTYDYDDFVRIIEAHPDATNIAFKFKFNGDHDNAPSTTSYGSTELIEAAGIGGWEDLKNYNGDSLTNIYGANISNDTTNYLRVISNGYDDPNRYIGQYATCWYVYAPTPSGGWDLVTKLPPSALVYENAEALGNSSNLSSYVEAYNKLQQYSDYAVRITYEGNANKANVSEFKRCDGKWYYTIKGQEIVGNILIQYENESIADRGTYTYDKFTGTGVGEKTGANPHFTNAEATDPHTFVTTLDNDKQFTFSADTTTGRYQFIGWYILESEGAEPTFYTKDIDASAVRNKSFTFVARYNYVDEIAEIHITYNFKDFQAADGEIAYTPDHNKANDTANSYSTKDSIIVAYTNNDEEIAKIVAKNAPIIHSDYYDYSLNNASITYSYNASTKIVYATATMDDTPHVYSVTVNGQKFTGYYQNTLELYADDFGLTYTDGATALWYLVDGTNETLYYDKFDLNYRFIVDKAELKVVANDGNTTSLDGKSVVYNSYYELGYKNNVQKITQNFYITDYLDCAYDDAGKVVEGAKNIKYVGGGILYYSSDENGIAINDTVKTALENKETIINSALGGNYTSDATGIKDKVGYVYSKYDPAKFRYSEFLIAYQHIVGITLNNTDANAGKHISAYSFFVYTYQVGETTYTQIQISDTMAVATAYEPN